MSTRIGHSVGYDLSLLSSVPDPIREVKQEGYKAGLENDRDGRAPGLPHGVGQPAVSDPDGTTIEYLGPTVAIDEPSKAPHGTTTVIQSVQPWYRRKWGFIGFVVVAFIIGGAVGGAIGATRRSHPYYITIGPSSNTFGFSTSEVGQGPVFPSATGSTSFTTSGPFVPITTTPGLISSTLPPG